MASTMNVGELDASYYKKMLMHHQWMLERPEDLAQKWLMLPCPRGRRVLVATREGETHIYTQNGFKIMSFQSHLPGGSKNKKNWQTETTMLDCIFNEENGVIHVVDLISWKGHSVSDSTFFLQAEFRFFWLKSKLEEIPELLEKTIHNPYKITSSTPMPCTTDSIQAVFEGEQKIDGLLFYHKESVYQAGMNPQVLWMKPYMIPEALSISVPESYMQEKPESYTDFTTYAEKKREELEKEGAAEKEKQIAKEQTAKKEKKQTKKNTGKEQTRNSSGYNQTKKNYGNYNQGNKIPSLLSMMGNLSLSETPERRPIGRGRGRAIFGQSMASDNMQRQFGYGCQQSFDVIPPREQPEPCPPPYPFGQTFDNSCNEGITNDYQGYYDEGNYNNYQQNYYQQEYDNYYTDQGHGYDQNQQYGYNYQQNYGYQQGRNQYRRPDKERQQKQRKAQVKKGKSKKESNCYGQYTEELMCSQWLTEVPQDFELDWLMVPCPTGKRRRVVAQNGVTIAYNKRDVEVERFKSQLAGGHEHYKSSEQNRTVLDCIYSKTDRIYYIIDIMVWKGQDLRESETGFRFYWLQSKLREEIFLTHTTKLNQYVFAPVPNFPCDQASLQEAMDGEFNYQLDGVLFYHKTGKYVSGSVNHVIWLKPYMLPEVLGVQVPEGYMTSKPPSYVDFQSYIKQFKEESHEGADTKKEEENKSEPVEATS